MKKPRGRPKLDPTLTKQPFPMRFSRKELAAFKKKAKKQKKELREWMAEALGKAAR